MDVPEWVFDETDRTFMERALLQARSAAGRGEVPVGAVLVRDGEILAEAGNERQSVHDVSAHAEILALRRAGAAAGDWRLEGCTMYVTLEPCAMCVAACRQARLRLVVWGAPDSRAGACSSTLGLAEDPRLGPPLAHRGGLLCGASRDLLVEFFANRRQSS
jgi:tRNA(adenine34) deaminase